MRLLVAIFLPPIVFFTIRRPFQGIFCMLLWMTVIGWPVAAIWAVYALSQYRNEELYRDYSRGFSQRHRRYDYL
jgi:uncharacterized membrane protein YqaE (UPF0057 family)